MTQLATIKIELGIEAARIINNYQTHNEQLEQQVANGIKLALDELLAGNNFERLIADQTKDEILSIVKKSIIGWDMRDSIRKALEAKIGEKINEYADKLADKMVDAIKVKGDKK